MQLKNFKSSTYSLTTDEVKILFDPWLVDGEYYGSWSHYPPVELDFDQFNDFDFICLTHIHPDHFSKKTFEKLNKKIPVIILDYKQKFLKINLQILGFDVIEIKHGSSVKFKDINIKVYAADNCDPDICKKFFGCGIFGQKNDQSNQIDSIFVVENNSTVLVNTNDVPYELAKDVLKDIKVNHKKIDFLLSGYSGAGPYPQCFANLSQNEQEKRAHKKKIFFLEQCVSIINTLNPTYYMPFAGQYTLSGKLSNLNKLRGIPSLLEAKAYLESKINVKAKCILLNFSSVFDFAKPKVPKFDHSIFKDEENYIKNSLSKIKFDYEKNNLPENYQIVDLLEKCFLRFEKKRQEINFISKTKIIIPLLLDKYLIIYLNGKNYEILNKDKVIWQDYLKIDIDLRLLYQILMGPKYAHWNNAEIGSHIKYFRSPDIYERGLFYCLNFFHQ